jgi:hypothetical protein
VIRVVRWVSDKWKSRERQSATMFSSPANHWLYRQLLDSITSLAKCLAVVIFTMSLESSLKFDFLSHPVADELSVWLSIQDSGFILLLVMSIHIVITLAINSSEFRDVRSRQLIGNSNLQAEPVAKLYPPTPNSEASERYICVGFLKTILFIDIPSLE